MVNSAKKEHRYIGKEKTMMAGGKKLASSKPLSQKTINLFGVANGYKSGEVAITGTFCLFMYVSRDTNIYRQDWSRVVLTFFVIFF